jgi:hypothetical protein
MNSSYLASDNPIAYQIYRMYTLDFQQHLLHILDDSPLIDPNSCCSTIFDDRKWAVLK